MKSLLAKIEAARQEAADLCARGEQIEAIRNGLQSLHDALAERDAKIPKPAEPPKPKVKAAEPTK